MLVTIDVTEEDIKYLKSIRNYFGQHDKTPLEHLSYDYLNDLLVKLTKGGDDMKDVLNLLHDMRDDIREDFWRDKIGGILEKYNFTV